MSHQLTIEEYSENSFVIRGNTKEYKEQLKTGYGRWNPRLKGGAGWIFSKNHMDTMKLFVNKINNETELKERKEYNQKFKPKPKEAEYDSDDEPLVPRKRVNMEAKYDSDDEPLVSRKRVNRELEKEQRKELEEQKRKELEEQQKELEERKELKKIRKELEEQIRKELEEQIRKELEEQIRKELETDLETDFEKCNDFKIDLESHPMPIIQAEPTPVVPDTRSLATISVANCRARQRAAMGDVAFKKMIADNQQKQRLKKKGVEPVEKELEEKKVFQNMKDQATNLLPNSCKIM